MSGSITRAAASRLLLRVIDENQPFTTQLVHENYAQMSAVDKSFVSHLCFGVLRFYDRLSAWLKTLVKSPLKSADRDVHFLLLVGLYQLFCSDVPQYAAIHATVDASKNLKKTWARALINGVLRQALRQQEQFAALSAMPAKFSHPQWFIERCQKAWPHQWEALLLANLEHPPLSLRVNLSAISLADYEQQLQEANIAFSRISHTQGGLMVDPSTHVFSLPGFGEGLVSVQDGAAQLAAGLLGLAPNQRVLDACAAPGGKTAHILESVKNTDTLALDIDPKRIELIQQTLQRQQLQAEVRCVDAAQTEKWWDQKPFDRILLDAPCTASGVIRRHPDIKYHRQPKDIEQLQQQQALLLRKLWPLLKPGGILVYATCSIFPEENGQQMEAFLQSQPDAQEWRIDEQWGHEQAVGRQILPGQHNMDGFYYARIRKIG